MHIDSMAPAWREGGNGNGNRSRLWGKRSNGGLSFRRSPARLKRQHRSVEPRAGLVDQTLSIPGRSNR